MDNIKVKVLNPEVVWNSEQMMVTAARLTQRGHEIHNLNDFMALYEKPYSSATVKNMASLPHPTIQKFGAINVVIVGASRRFLAQITRHQNEVKFMSASCQYSDYSGSADFVIPYEILDNKTAREQYIKSCKNSLEIYEKAICEGMDHDSAAYMLPQGLRNILIMSATPYQWKHMIGQRICRRNTLETRYVILLIWKELCNLSPMLFATETTGAFCQKGKCLEGKMTCGNPFDIATTPDKILNDDFSKIYKEVKSEDQAD